jgi:hypothetical protein
VGVIPSLSKLINSTACGNAKFTESIQKKVREIMSKDNIIVFAEVEYRPEGFRDQDDVELQLEKLQKGVTKNALRKRLTGRVKHKSEEVELVKLPTRETRNVLSKAPGMQVIGRAYKNDDDIENAPKVDATVFV